MFKQYFSNQTKRTQQLTAILAVLIVAAIGTYLLTGSHAATPYASITADSGTLASGAIKQTCTGASDGNCVVFGGSGDTGAINYLVGLSGIHDQYDTCPGTVSGTPPACSPFPQYASWYQQHIYRAIAYESHFERGNGGLSWLPNTWVYDDSYAIYTGSGEPTTWIEAHHPSWILRDASGSPLYINFACSGGTCTQYAGDIGNTQYTNYWLTGCAVGNINNPGNTQNPYNCDTTAPTSGGDEGGLEATIALGYKGVMVDDVNMNMDVSNGNGTAVDPIDTNTNTAMTPDAWSQYMANFMIAIRKAMPNIEIMHNVPWFQGGGTGTTACIFIPGSCGSTTTDQTALNEEIQSANWINLERGVVDGGLNCGNTPTCGDWTFSLDTLFQYVDYVHNKGANVSYASYATDTNSDNFPNSSNAASLTDIEYNLAAYLLTSNGQDLVGDSGNVPVKTVYNGVTYNTLWSGYARDLGTANGARYMVNRQYYRRDFSKGMVLLNPPASPNANGTVTVQLGGTYYEVNSSGNKIAVTSVTLNSQQGAVLTTQ